MARPKGWVLAIVAAFVLVHAQVYSGGKDHALYLIIHLTPNADAKKLASIVADLPNLVAKIAPPETSNESDEVWAGVGFGPSFYQRLGQRPPSTYVYPNRSGVHGAMPATGGDIFIHAKTNSRSKLYELADEVEKAVPVEAVADFEDVYGFTYRDGRDLSGFIDGTANPSGDQYRAKVAVNPTTNGSFCITQKWIHDHTKIRAQKS